MLLSTSARSRSETARLQAAGHPYYSTDWASIGATNSVSTTLRLLLTRPEISAKLRQPSPREPPQSVACYRCKGIAFHWNGIRAPSAAEARRSLGLDDRLSHGRSKLFLESATELTSEIVDVGREFELVHPSRAQLRQRVL